MCETLCPKAAGGEPGVTSCLASSIKGYDQMRSPKAFFVFGFFCSKHYRMMSWSYSDTQTEMTKKGQKEDKVE